MQGLTQLIISCSQILQLFIVSYRYIRLDYVPNNYYITEPSTNKIEINVEGLTQLVADGTQDICLDSGPNNDNKTEPSTIKMGGLMQLLAYGAPDYYYSSPYTNYN